MILTPCKYSNSSSDEEGTWSASRRACCDTTSSFVLSDSIVFWSSGEWTSVLQRTPTRMFSVDTFSWIYTTWETESTPTRSRREQLKTIQLLWDIKLVALRRHQKGLQIVNRSVLLLSPFLRMIRHKQHYWLAVAMLISFQLRKGWNKGIIQRRVLGSSSSAFTACSTHHSLVFVEKVGGNKVRMIESAIIWTTISTLRSNKLTSGFRVHLNANYSRKPIWKPFARW